MSDELVTIADFLTLQEAEIARGFLESNGIQVFLKGAVISRIASHITPTMGAVRIQVRREDEDTALGLLRQVDSNPELQ